MSNHHPEIVATLRAIAASEMDGERGIDEIVAEGGPACARLLARVEDEFFILVEPDDAAALNSLDELAELVDRILAAA